MSAEWRSDPTGRHQLRWWDGQAWTDHVADNGATSIDPYLAPPPVVPTPNVPPPAPAASATPSAPVAPAAPLAPSAPLTTAVPTAPSPQPAYLSGGVPPSENGVTTPRKKSGLVVAVGGAVAAVVLIVVLVFVVGGGGGGDSSTARGEIRGDEALGLGFTAEAGEVIVVFIEPLGDDDDVEFESGMLFTEDRLRDHYEAFLDFEEEQDRFPPFYEDFDDYEDAYSRYPNKFEDYDLGDLDDRFGDGYFLSGTSQTEFPGPDSWWEVIPVDGEYSVAVLPIDGSGEIEIRIERCPSSVDLTDYYRAIGDNDELFDVIGDACDDVDVPLGS